MGTDREYLLNSIEVGDLFFAVASNGDPRIMLAGAVPAAFDLSPP
jgi:hypothetical protein